MMAMNMSLNMIPVKKTPGDVQWFVHDRFGLFIHWGIYALPARHEWVKTRERIPEEKYDIYFKNFDPDLYDPEAWMDVAYRAGMRYVVVTTKHHDGFCLWDSALTDYKATNTPARRDLIKPLVEAARARNMRVGFYYSLIDWHHPDFVIDGIHPLRDHPDVEALNQKRNQERFAAYLHGQVEELLTRFGQVDIMWLDFSYPNRPGGGKGRADWQSEKLYSLIRRLQPNIILNDRMDLDEGWDLVTPEQLQPREWVTIKGERVVWEACQTFSGSWGYYRDEASWKSVDQLVRMLIDTVSKGGNLLLNVGPTARGEFDYRALERLNGIGEWMKWHSRSIYGCTQAPEDLVAPEDCRYTYNPETGRLYVHLFAWPFKHLHLDGLAGKVEYAQLLNDASEIQIDTSLQPGDKKGFVDRQTLTLVLPVQKPPVTVPVIELFMKK